MVDKYMREEKVDRTTAQRNMDAFLADPNGWVIQKQRQIKLGEEVDYNYEISTLDKIAGAASSQLVRGYFWTLLRGKWRKGDADLNLCKCLLARDSLPPAQ